MHRTPIAVGVGLGMGLVLGVGSGLAMLGLAPREQAKAVVETPPAAVEAEAATPPEPERRAPSSEPVAVSAWLVVVAPDAPEETRRNIDRTVGQTFTTPQLRELMPRLGGSAGVRLIGPIAAMVLPGETGIVHSVVDLFERTGPMGTNPAVATGTLSGTMLEVRADRNDGLVQLRYNLEHTARIGAEQGAGSRLRFTTNSRLALHPGHGSNTAGAPLSAEGGAYWLFVAVD